MIAHFDTAPIAAGYFTIYNGWGVPGADVPQIPTGGDTGSMMNESVSRPADNAVEFRFAIVSGPTGGASFTQLEETGAYTLSVPGDGTYTWTFNLWRDGVLDVGSPFTGTATVGGGGTTVSVSFSSGSTPADFLSALAGAITVLTEAASGASSISASAAANTMVTHNSTAGDQDTSFAQAVSLLSAALATGTNFTGLIETPGVTAGLLLAESFATATFTASAVAASAVTGNTSPQEAFSRIKSVTASITANTTAGDTDVPNAQMIVALTAGLIAGEDWAATVASGGNLTASLVADSSNAAAFVAAAVSMASMTETSTPGASFDYLGEIAFLVAEFDLQPVIDAAISLVPALGGKINLH